MRDSILDNEQVKKVASLARLSLAEHEIEATGRQLTSILDYVHMLNDVDVDGVEPMTHPVAQHNVFRADETTDSLPRDAALSNAPKTDGEYFLVPPILDQKGA